MESLAGSRLEAMAIEAARLIGALPQPLTPAQHAGWEVTNSSQNSARMRIRHRVASMWDAIIAGEGPAGAVAAHVLRRAAAESF